MGIDPPQRVILPDTPAVRATLRHLRVEADAGEASRAAVRDLRAAGLLLEDGQPDSTTPGGPAARRVAEAQFGEDAARRLVARAAAGIGIRAESAGRAAAARLLRAAGIGLVEPGELPSAWLVITDDEPLRADLDPLVREGAPHLLVRCGSIARIGPFVVPGRTACLRCVDAHLSESDPRRPLVMEQAARAGRAAGATPVDPTLETLALAWAVRDLARYAEGDRPATWSAVVSIGHDGPAVRREWDRHPHCGCAWDELP